MEGAQVPEDAGVRRFDLGEFVGPLDTIERLAKAEDGRLIDAFGQDINLGSPIRVKTPEYRRGGNVERSFHVRIGTKRDGGDLGSHLKSPVWIDTQIIRDTRRLGFWLSTGSR
jgi:hypothetical protein